MKKKDGRLQGGEVIWVCLHRMGIFMHVAVFLGHVNTPPKFCIFCSPGVAAGRRCAIGNRAY